MCKGKPNAESSHQPIGLKGANGNLPCKSSSMCIRTGRATRHMGISMIFNSVEQRTSLKFNKTRFSFHWFSQPKISLWVLFARFGVIPRIEEEHCVTISHCEQVLSILTHQA